MQPSFFKLTSAFIAGALLTFSAQSFISTTKDSSQPIPSIPSSPKSSKSDILPFGHHGPTNDLLQREAYSKICLSFLDIFIYSIIIQQTNQKSTL